jgi:lipopolysaccharide export LptBFGC system permease protein LptF
LTSLRSVVLNRFILDTFCSNALIILVLFFHIVGSQNLRHQIPDKGQISFLHFLFFVSL